MLNKLCALQPALVSAIIEQGEKWLLSSEPSPPDENNTPEWCKCGRCHPMATLREQLYCGCLPQNCHSALPVSTILQIFKLALILL